MKSIGTDIIVKKVLDYNVISDGLIIPANLKKRMPVAAHIVSAVGDMVNSSIQIGDVVYCAKGCGESFEYVDLVSGEKVAAMRIKYDNVIAYRKKLAEHLLSQESVRDIIAVRDVVLMRLKQKPQSVGGISLIQEDNEYVGNILANDLFEQEAEVLSIGEGYYNPELSQMTTMSSRLEKGVVVRYAKSIPLSWCFEYKGEMIAYAGEQDCWAVNE